MIASREGRKSQSRADQLIQTVKITVKMTRSVLLCHNTLRARSAVTSISEDRQNSYDSLIAFHSLLRFVLQQRLSPARHRYIRRNEMVEMRKLSIA